jgi:hypothetical protein
LPLSHESGLILQNERCCLGGQPINQALLAFGCAVNILDARQATLGATGCHITARAQNKPVQPVRGKGVILSQPMINKNRKLKRVAEPDGCVKHRIVVRA